MKLYMKIFGMTFRLEQSIGIGFWIFCSQSMEEESLNSMKNGGEGVLQLNN